MQKIKLGIIGIGNMGSAHANNIVSGKCPEIELCAVADIKQKRLDWAKENLPQSVKTFSSAEEMLDSGLINACLVAVPHYEHPHFAIECFKRNINVMVEKPAGVYTKQVNIMNEESKKTNAVFAMMFNQRTNPLYIRMKQIVDIGEMGNIKRVSWIITDWYRTQSYYDSGDWRATWSGEGGGVLLNQCPHQLDLLQWICGMPKTVLTKMHFGKWHDIEVEDDVTTYLEYENGATGVFITTTGDAPGTNRFEIDLEKGKLVCEDNKLKIWKSEVNEREWVKTCNEGFKKPDYEYSEWEPQEKATEHVGVLNAFADCILHNGKLIANGKEGIKGLTLSNAMHLSAFLDKQISLPFDEDLYYQELMKRVKTSKRKTNVKEQVNDDMSGTY